MLAFFISCFLVGVHLYHAEYLQPEPKNVANTVRASLSATSTCGLRDDWSPDFEPPETFCLLSGYSQHSSYSYVEQGQQCDECHPEIPAKFHGIRFAVDGTEKYWMSPPLSRGPKYTDVNVTINFGQVYHVSYVRLTFANSPPPAAWAIYKSVDFGVTFTAWQFFAQTADLCQEMFKMNPQSNYPRTDSVTCKTYSYNLASSFENVEFPYSLTNGRPGENSFASNEEIQQWTKATNVKLVFLKPNTLGADRISDTTQVTRRFFYSLSSIYIHGICVCNGHAERCTENPVDGAMKCECSHNTCGASCDECCPGFVQKPWRKATDLEPFQCEPCECFDHAASCRFNETVNQLGLSLDSSGNYQGGGVCVDCQDNTEGINCEKCAFGFYRPVGVSQRSANACQPCRGCLNSMFLSGACKEGSGQCLCKERYSGEQCDQCSPGFTRTGFPDCGECPCSIDGTLNQQCTYTTSCPCKPQFQGILCDQCRDTFYQFPTCHGCNCDPVGSVSATCDQSTGQCTCSPLYTGRRCDQCVPGSYMHLGRCTTCNCYPGGSVGEECDSSTGQCTCKEGYTGLKCDQCRDEFFYTSRDPLVCKPCGCNVQFASSNVCLKSSGLCPCKPRYQNDFNRQCTQCAPGHLDLAAGCVPCGCHPQGATGGNCDRYGRCQCRPDATIAGEKCDRCAPGRYNFPTCEECSCHPAGVLSAPEAAQCHSSTGRCTCKSHVTSAACDTCLDGYFNLRADNPAGCEGCGCDVTGTRGGLNVCHQETGQCECNGDRAGVKCDQCAPGFFSPSPTSTPCEPCGCDLGGATGPACDASGVCTCIPGVTGLKCDRVRDGYFLPGMRQLTYQLEDAYQTGDSSSDRLPARFGFSHSAFPGFAGRGYATMSSLQPSVSRHVTIQGPHGEGTWLLQLRYKTREDATVNVTVTTDRFGGAQKRSQVLLAGSQLSTVSQPLALAPGTEYRFTLETEGGSSLLLDWFALVPTEYSDATLLHVPVTGTCGRADRQRCVELVLPDIEDDSHWSSVISGVYQAYSSTNRISCGNLRASGFNLPASDLVDIRASSGVSRLTVELTDIPAGQFVLLLEYATSRVQSQRGGGLFQTWKVSWNTQSEPAELRLKPCYHDFTCRAVAVTQIATPQTFTLADSQPVHVSLMPPDDSTGRYDSSDHVYMYRVHAVPLTQWRVDMVTHAFKCIRQNLQCIDSSWDLPPSAVVLLPTDNGDSVRARRAIEDNNRLVQVGPRSVSMTQYVPTAGAYRMYVHYYNPDGFGQTLDISSGWKAGSADIAFCPSTSGCLAPVSLQSSDTMTLTSGLVEVTLSPGSGVTPGSEVTPVYVERVILVPEGEQLDLTAHTVDLSDDFVNDCAIPNDFDIKSSGYYSSLANGNSFCQQSLFSLSSALHRTTAACGCHPLGSSSPAATCDAMGGQCVCRPHVIGRECGQCASGHYAFPDCFKCKCDNVMCDRFGNCECPPRVTGEYCDSCAADTFGLDPVLGCADCACHPLGSTAGSCDVVTGQCACRAENVAGRRCDQCAPGFFAFPHCKPCDCNTNGTTSQVCDPSTGDCVCKSLVQGARCDTCAPSSFNLHPDHPEGCLSCFCLGLSTACEQNTQLRRVHVTDMSSWKLDPASPLAVNSDGVTATAELPYSQTQRTDLYWVAPKAYLQDIVSAYGGYLSFDLLFSTTSSSLMTSQSDDVIIEGGGLRLVHSLAEQPVSGQNNTRTVRVVEGSFRVGNRQATRVDVMNVLTYVKSLRIRASFAPNPRLVAISRVSLGLARLSNDSSLAVASEVEVCQCAGRNSGTSCQKCNDGFTFSRSLDTSGYLKSCQACHCIHASTCHHITGQCELLFCDPVIDDCDYQADQPSDRRRRGHIDIFNCDSKSTEGCGMPTRENLPSQPVFNPQNSAFGIRIRCNSGVRNSCYIPHCIDTPEYCITITCDPLFGSVPCSMPTACTGELCQVIIVPTYDPSQRIPGECSRMTAGLCSVGYCASEELCVRRIPQLIDDNPSFINCPDAPFRCDPSVGTCSRGYCGVSYDSSRDDPSCVSAVCDAVTCRRAEMDTCSGLLRVSEQPFYVCRDNTMGPRCDQCLPGYYGDASLPGPTVCKPCPCPNIGNSHSSCSVDLLGQVTCGSCPEQFSGAHCENCAPGYYGNPLAPGGTCHKCQCNNNSALTSSPPIGEDGTEECDQYTGMCNQCIYNTAGKHCERCIEGYYGDALRTEGTKCTRCNCDQCGAETCDGLSGECQCRANVIGSRCTQCAPNHFGFSSCEGCQACNCSALGSLSAACDPKRGQCRCKEGVGGRACDQCLPTFKSYSSAGCVPCNCPNNKPCDSDTGMCLPCPELHQETARGCEPCGTCIDQLLEALHPLTRQIDAAKELVNATALANAVQRKLQRYNWTVGNLTEGIALVDEMNDFSPDMDDLQISQSAYDYVMFVDSELNSRANQMTLLDHQLRAFDQQQFTQPIEDYQRLATELLTIQNQDQTAMTSTIDDLLDDFTQTLEQMTSRDNFTDHVRRGDTVHDQAERVYELLTEQLAPVVAINNLSQSLVNQSQRLLDDVSKLRELGRQSDQTAGQVLANLSRIDADTSQYKRDIPDAAEQFALLEQFNNNSSVNIEHVRQFLENTTHVNQEARGQISSLTTNYERLQGWIDGFNKTASDLHAEVNQSLLEVDVLKHAITANISFTNMTALMNNMTEYFTLTLHLTDHIDRAASNASRALQLADMWADLLRGWPGAVSAVNRETRALARRDHTVKGKDAEKEFNEHLGTIQFQKEQIKTDLDAMRDVMDHTDPDALLEQAANISRLADQMLEQTASTAYDTARLRERVQASLGQVPRLEGDLNQTRDQVQLANQLMAELPRKTKEAKDSLLRNQLLLNKTEDVNRRASLHFLALRDRIREIRSAINTGVWAMQYEAEQGSYSQLRTPALLRQPAIQHDIRIHFSTRTTPATGLLFLIGTEGVGDFMALQLVPGQVQFTWSNGIGQRHKLALAGVQFSQSEAYSVRIQRSGFVVRLTVYRSTKAASKLAQEGEVVASREARFQDHELFPKVLLDLRDDSHFFLGGLPKDSELGGLLGDYSHFSGCIRIFMVDNVVMNPWNYIRASNVQSCWPESRESVYYRLDDFSFVCAWEPEAYIRRTVHVNELYNGRYVTHDIKLTDMQVANSQHVLLHANLEKDDDKIFLMHAYQNDPYDVRFSAGTTTFDPVILQGRRGGNSSLEELKIELRSRDIEFDYLHQLKLENSQSIRMDHQSVGLPSLPKVMDHTLNLFIGGVDGVHRSDVMRLNESSGGDEVAVDESLTGCYRVRELMTNSVFTSHGEWLDDGYEEWAHAGLYTHPFFPPRFTTLSLQGRPGADFTLDDVTISSRLLLQLKTSASEGLVLFLLSPDQRSSFSMSLLDGYLHIWERRELSLGRVYKLKSARPINDGLWHSVVVNKHSVDDTWVLVVDDSSGGGSQGLSAAVPLEDKSTIQDFSGPVLHVGGLHSPPPASLASSAAASFAPFRGCLRDLLLNSSSQTPICWNRVKPGTHAAGYSFSCDRLQKLPELWSIDAHSTRDIQADDGSAAANRQLCPVDQSRWRESRSDSQSFSFLHPESRLHFNISQMHNQQLGEISLNVQSQCEDGVILTLGDLSLEFAAGNIVLRLNSDDNRKVAAKIACKLVGSVMQNQWTSLKVMVSNDLVSLRIDGEEIQSVLLSQLYPDFDPEHVISKISAGSSRGKPGFMGCLRDVVFNGHTLTPLSHFKVIPCNSEESTVVFGRKGGTASLRFPYIVKNSVTILAKPRSFNVGILSIEYPSSSIQIGVQKEELSLEYFGKNFTQSELVNLPTPLGCESPDWLKIHLIVDQSDALVIVNDEVKSRPIRMTADDVTKPARIVIGSEYFVGCVREMLLDEKDLDPKLISLEGDAAYELCQP